MRTTVELDPDVAAAVEQMRREHGMALSEAVNTLARRGLTRPPERKPFVQRTEPLGLKVDVTCVSEALELLEDLDADAR
jgi:hypothetical protein